VRGQPNPRKPIMLMLAVGITVILALTFTPYALITRARKAVASIVRVPDSAALKEVAAERPATPPFDVARWYEERGEDPARHGVLVVSADGRQTFAEHNADTAFNPASLIKLATSLAALRRLGKDFRFETRVYLDGNANAGGAVTERKAAEAPADEKAAKTEKAGKAGARSGRSGKAAAKTEIDKRAAGKASTERGGSTGGRIFVAGNDPTFGDFDAALISRKLEERGVKKFAGEVAVSPDFVYNFSGDPIESAERLAKVMKLGAKSYAVGEAPAAPPAFVVHSYPLREILLYMNAHSSNFVAERLGALVGGPEGLRGVLVNELQLPADRVTISTASGLETNRLTARGLVAIIRALEAEAERQGLKLSDIMPVASSDHGTLRRRLAGTPLERSLVGKTGTLVHDDGGMASLGGVVYTQKAGRVYFVVLSQGSAVAESRQMTDLLLVQIILEQDMPAQLPLPEQPRHQLERTDIYVSE
jgi:D-alanyl-D-alanine carboxypeptidase/D-alanyl-D-alanine-endopeptidase (penicillin-binding protein 4)